MGPKKKDKKDDGDGEEGGGKKYGGDVPAAQASDIHVIPSRLSICQGRWR